MALISRYTNRVQLLVDILPVLAQEPRFALKVHGNQFVRA